MVRYGPLVNGWISVNRGVGNIMENPCKTEASRKAVPLDLRIVPFFQRWYEVSLFKASDDYVFAADVLLPLFPPARLQPADRLGIKPAVFGGHTFRRPFASTVGDQQKM